MLESIINYLHIICPMLISCIWFCYHFLAYTPFKKKMKKVSTITCWSNDFADLYNKYIDFQVQDLKKAKSKIQILEAERDDRISGPLVTFLILLITITTNIVIKSIISQAIDLIFWAFIVVFGLVLIHHAYNDRMLRYIKSHLIVIEYVLEMKNP